jgi:hypothetical protein
MYSYVSFVVLNDIISICLLFDFIDALATTIKNCISQLNDLSENTARFYCGYTLMKHCAVNVGLERFRLNFQARSPMDD